MFPERVESKLAHMQLSGFGNVITVISTWLTVSYCVDIKVNLSCTSTLLVKRKVNNLNIKENVCFSCLIGIQQIRSNWRKWLYQTAQTVLVHLPDSSRKISGKASLNSSTP